MPHGLGRPGLAAAANIFQAGAPEQTSRFPELRLLQPVQDSTSRLAARDELTFWIAVNEASLKSVQSKR